MLDGRLEEEQKIEQELKNKLSSLLNLAENSPKILAALNFVENINKQSSAPSNKSHFINALSVANILASMSMDIDAIIAGLFYAFELHNHSQYKDITSHFGDEVVYLTSRLDALDQLQLKKGAFKKKDFINSFIEIAEGDTRVMSIKLSERLYVMRSMQAQEVTESKRKIAQETMQVYVPLSERFGMQVIKNELQELTFSILSPAVKQSIMVRLSAFRSGCMQLIPAIIKSLKDLMDQHNIEAHVFGREKTPYSILDKMKRKRISFRRISDIIAFRVLVNDVNSCYLALGAIHTHYQNLPGHFKDFISAPKENNYRSLHTIVVGPNNKIMEVQIRTYEMQNFAEYGLAAHECYKRQHKVKSIPSIQPVHATNDIQSSLSFNGAFDSRYSFMMQRERAASNGSEYKKFTYNVLSKALCHTLQDDTGNGIQASLSDFADIQEALHHSSSIYFTVENSPGALADVAKEMAAHHVNIDNIKTLKRTDDFSEIRLDLTLKNMDQLAIVLDALKNKRYISFISPF